MLENFRANGLNSPARLSFVLKAPLGYLRLNIIYPVPCDRIVQRAYLTTLLFGITPISRLLFGY